MSGLFEVPLPWRRLVWGRSGVPGNKGIGYLLALGAR